DIHRDRGFLAHAAFSALRKAARMRWGVAGISLISTPNGESASLIALTTAAGAPIVPPSPRPFACVMKFDFRNFARGRRQIVGQRRRKNTAGFVVDDFLEQRVADSLRDAAMHLA